MSKVAPCLVVFCRRPRPGVGKQRLAGDIGAAAAAQVAAALWQCVREDVLAWPGDAVLAVTDPEEKHWADAEARTLGAAKVLVQSPGNLGERIAAVDRSLRTAGYQQLVFIGSDAPALGRDLLDEMVAILQHADVALAPADDGGVVAMAARKPWPALSDLPWSSHLLGGALRDRCVAAGQGVSMARGSFDVDDLASLRQAGVRLRGDPRPARRELAALAIALTGREAP